MPHRKIDSNYFSLSSSVGIAGVDFGNIYKDAVVQDHWIYDGGYATRIIDVGTGLRSSWSIPNFFHFISWVIGLKRFEDIRDFSVRLIFSKLIIPCYLETPVILYTCNTFIYSKYRTQNSRKLCNSLTTDQHGGRKDMNFAILCVQSTRCGDWTHDPIRGPDLKSGALTTRPTWLCTIKVINNSYLKSCWGDLRAVNYFFI